MDIIYSFINKLLPCYPTPRIPDNNDIVPDTNEIPQSNKVKIELENKFITNIYVWVDKKYIEIDINKPPIYVKNLIDTWFSRCSNGKYMAKYGLYMQLEHYYNNRKSGEWFHDHVTEIIFRYHKNKVYPLVGKHII